VSLPSLLQKEFASESTHPSDWERNHGGESYKVIEQLWQSFGQCHSKEHIIDMGVFDLEEQNWPKIKITLGCMIFILFKSIDTNRYHACMTKRIWALTVKVGSETT